MLSWKPEDFPAAVIAWYQQYGRKDLPWQQDISPYRVWVSEIMLQQTQVATVIPYFQRFVSHFPTVEKLANADLDEVLHLWSGLGYYARARHLHKAANVVIHQYDGQFPADLQQLADLPGIGLSTAGAILSLAMHQPATILDGNVKRVLARVFALPEWPGSPAATKILWAHATQLTPQTSTHHYNQAMMDLGAMICTRSQPRCQECPLTSFCAAFQQHNVQAFPVPKPRKSVPKRHVFLLVLQNTSQEILLIKRPPSGIWGGLWSLPECSEPEYLENWCKKNLSCTINNIRCLPDIQHVFTHFHLTMTPVYAQVRKISPAVMDAAPHIWYNNKQIHTIGLPAPIQKFLTAQKSLSGLTQSA